MEQFLPQQSFMGRRGGEGGREAGQAGQGSARKPLHGYVLNLISLFPSLFTGLAGWGWGVRLA